MTTIQNTNQAIARKPLLTARNTGFMAMGAMGLTCATAMVKNKKAWKMHKPLAYISATLALLHLGTAVHNNLHNKKNTEFIA